jgi:hypothetical protein
MGRIVGQFQLERREELRKEDRSSQRKIHRTRPPRCCPICRFPNPRWWSICGKGESV